MDLPQPEMTSSTPPSIFPCPHADAELVHRLAQLLLPGLAAACVDATTGDPFNTPSSVAVDLRHHLVNSHLLPLSTSFIPSSLSLLSSSTDHLEDLDLPDLSSPDDVISFLLEQFAVSRRTVLARLSTWLLSDSRDDKIDDFVHHLDSSNFWSLDRREDLSRTLLCNLDFKNNYHCNEKFDDVNKLNHHLPVCPFRAVECTNDGCKVRFSKMYEERHDGACMYKVLECEQGCGGRVVRREMDRHCVTVCRMRMGNCPFYQVGCRESFAVCRVEEHCREKLGMHLGMVMRVAGKDKEEGTLLAEQMEKSEFRDKLASALTVRSLTTMVKNILPKLPKLEKPPKPKVELNSEHTSGKEDVDSKKKDPDHDLNKETIPNEKTGEVNDSTTKKLDPSEQDKEVDTDKAENPEVVLDKDSQQNKNDEKEDTDSTIRKTEDTDTKTQKPEVVQATDGHQSENEREDNDSKIENDKDAHSREQEVTEVDTKMTKIEL